MYSQITAVASYLPKNKLTNEELNRQYPEWSVEKIENKTGIKERAISEPDEFSLEMGEAAAQKLFSRP